MIQIRETDYITEFTEYCRNTRISKLECGCGGVSRFGDGSERKGASEWKEM